MPPFRCGDSWDERLGLCFLSKRFSISSKDHDAGRSVACELAFAFPPFHDSVNTSYRYNEATSEAVVWLRMTVLNRTDR